MRRISVKVIQVTSVSLFLLLVASSFQSGYAQTQDPNKAATQTPTPPSWLAITVVNVRPEKVADFQDFVKTVTNPGLRKGGAKWRNVYQTAAFGDVFEYVIVAPIENFAQYDGPSALEKGLGKEAFEAWRTRSSQIVASVHTYAARERQDLSYQGKMTGPPKLAVVSSVHVAPGRSEEFENFLKNDYLPVIKQSQIPGYFVSQTVFGGDAFEYITVTLADNFADIDKGPPIMRVLGEQGAMKLLQKLAPGVVTRLDRSVIRYVPELSIMPAEKPSK